MIAPIAPDKKYAVTFLQSCTRLKQIPDNWYFIICIIFSFHIFSGIF